MSLESATYINQLVATNPTAADPKSQGDDHLRLLKGVLQAQFPNLGAAAVTVLASELNALAGISSAVQTQLNAKAPLASPALTGTPTAPTAAALTSNTQIASTAYADAAVAVEAGLRVAADALKATKAGDVYTGTHDFGGASWVRVPLPASGNDAASKFYVDSAAMSPVLPGQPGGSTPYALISVNGIASWVAGLAPDFLLMNAGVV